MKKIAILVTSLLLVAAVATGVLAGTGFLSNDKLDDIIETPYENGESFLKSTKRAPAFSDLECLKAVDGNDDSFWTVAAEETYTQLNFDKLTSINNIEIKEIGSTVRKYRIEAWDGLKWVKVYGNDIIEGYYCAVIDTIKTSALRMYVEKGSGAKIAELSACYQRPVEYDREFINMSYITTNQYFHDWFVAWEPDMAEKTFDSLSDLYMIGMFSITDDGEFIITRQNYGSDNSVKARYPALSAEADIMVSGEDMSTLPKIEGVRDFPKGKKGGVPYLKEKLGNAKPRLWFSLAIEGNAGTLDAFNDQTIREKFISDVVTFAKRHGYGGVDIDWEYPNTPAAWSAYEALVDDLSVALHAEELLFSSAHSARYKMGLKPETLNKFDRINMMAYDQTGSSASGHHSSYQNSTIQEIQAYLEKGVKPEKLVLGLAYYSSQGQVGYSKIFKQMEAYLDDGEQVDPGTNFFKTYTFNGPNLIKDRTLYAIKRKLGGVFSWHISCDMQWDHYASLARVQQETINTYIKQAP